MKSSTATLDAQTMATDEHKELFDKVSPAMRGSLARDVVSEYRRWVLAQIANASRSGATEQLQQMKKLKEKLAGEFDLVIRGDEAVIYRALTEYRIILTRINKGQAPQNNLSGGIDGGPV